MLITQLISSHNDVVTESASQDVSNHQMNRLASTSPALTASLTPILSSSAYYALPIDSLRIEIKMGCNQSSVKGLTSGNNTNCKNCKNCSNCTDCTGR